MSFTLVSAGIDPCDLKWWTVSTVIPGGGQYEMQFSVDRPGQPIAFSCVQQDGDPVSISIDLSGTNYINQMQVGASSIITTANLPVLVKNQPLLIRGQGTGGGTVTFSLLIKTI